MARDKRRTRKRGEEGMSDLQTCRKNWEICYLVCGDDGETITPIRHMTEDDVTDFVRTNPKKFKLFVVKKESGRKG
jgi:hypothetical protein